MQQFHSDDVHFWFPSVRLTLQVINFPYLLLNNTLKSFIRILDDVSMFLNYLSVTLNCYFFIIPFYI